MKGRRLILEADNNTESRAAVSRGRPTPEAGAKLNMMREKEAPVKKERWTSAVSPTPVVSSRVTRKEKGKAIMTEEVPPGRDEITSAGIRMKTPLERPAEVLTMSSNIEDDPVALEKVFERAVEDVGGEACGPQKYLDRKREKYAGATTNGSYVELVRNMTRAKVAATSVATAKEQYNQATEAKYKVFWRRLTEEVEKRRYL
ncbi:hypothetical protein AXG93_242s1360 [Marchantia polymorpha subsp. ruderalis]|uniref:Uncharacterized protein n=1 Tax=Marchantia polymorpha subsp. ruderalis TaxID=1480154 RepID=A0A176VNG4_MARPO|nr:hypothetical protein AXG93_242s1360 [Marchantia polymorpha subsp. ruderalis]